MDLNISQKISENSGLGTITKSHSPFAQMPCPVDVSRVKDFLLQDLASKVLQKKFRVQFCLKRKIDKNNLVNVCFNESTSKAHYGNVIRCGSVWVCPVCAKKITEHRRTELKNINTMWKNGITLYVPEKMDENFIGPPIHHAKDVKGFTYLLTLTSPHYAYQNLSLLRERMTKAKDLFFGGKKNSSLFQKQLGKIFHVTNLEVTYGQNGWHPHNHILIFSDKYLSIQEFTRIKILLADHWSNCLSKVGIRKLVGDEKYIACDLQDGTYAEQYVSKWGIESEMTKGHLKQGRESSITPFDLLRLSENDDLIFDKKPSDLFREFANAFKGARQLSFSRGLKRAFAINEKDDDEIMSETLDEAIFLRDIDDYAFKLICKNKKRAEFLDLVTEDYLTGSNLADELISYLSDLDLKTFNTEILPDMQSNSAVLSRVSLPEKSTPWISSKEFDWIQNIKNEQVTKIDIDESMLPLIAEHLAWLESQRDST